MKKLLIIFILIAGCSTQNNKLGNDNLNIDFSNDMSFKEFQIKLEEYGKNSPYPNIND